MYILIVVLAALLFGIAEVLGNNYQKSIFVSWKPERFWNPNFRKEVLRVRQGNMEPMEPEDLITTPYWYSAVNISLYMGFLFLIMAATLAQLPVFQIRGFSLLWQIIICAVLFLAVYNYSVHKLFISKRTSIW